MAESCRAEDAARVSSYHPFPVRSDSSRDFTQRLCSGVPGLLFRLLPICIHNTPETLSTCRDRPADTSPNGGTLCNSGNHSSDARPHRRFQSGANHLNMDVPGLTDTAWLRGREGGDEMPGHASPWNEGPVSAKDAATKTSLGSNLGLPEGQSPGPTVGHCRTQVPISACGRAQRKVSKA